MKKFLLLLLVLMSLTGLVCAEQEATPTEMDIPAVTVSFGGLTFSSADEAIDLGDVKVKDFKAFCAFLDKMPNLKKVDMFATRIYRNNIDMLAERYPQIKFGWTMVLRSVGHKDHLIRTDVTAWSTLHNNKTALHSSDEFAILKYCTDLVALDVGHNGVTNLDFLYDLPNLKVLILAANHITDITPVGSLTQLEYLEIFKNKITDFSPLANLTNLIDLNVCFNRCTDLTPILGLPHLRRLWIYNSNNYNAKDPIPADVVAALRESMPQCKVDSKHYSTAGGWREHPRYNVIFKMFSEFTYIPFAPEE